MRVPTRASRTAAAFALATALLALATATAFALTGGRQPVPSASDLPRVVTARALFPTSPGPAAPTTSASETPSLAPTSAAPPAAPAPSTRAPSSGGSGSGDASPDEHDGGVSSSQEKGAPEADHETVEPKLHESEERPGDTGDAH